MKKIIGVRFKKPGKIYFFDPGNLEINKNDNVIVETTMGEEIGIVIVPKREIQEEKMATPLKKVIRVANKNDLDSLEKYKKKEPEALRICKENIKEMAKNYGKKEEELLENENLKEYLKNNITTEKAIQFIVDNAKI